MSARSLPALACARRRRGAYPRVHRGFTLIEILLAMLIFMSGVAGIYALLSTGVGMQKEGLELGQLTRKLDEVIHQLEQEIGEGRHYDAQAEAWVDIAEGRLSDGTLFSARFVPEDGNPAEGSLLVILRVARSPAALGRAHPVPAVLTPGPTMSTAVRRYRQR